MYFLSLYHPRTNTLQKMHTTSALCKWTHNSFVLRATKLKSLPICSVGSGVSNIVWCEVIRSTGKLTALVNTQKRTKNLYKSHLGHRAVNQTVPHVIRILKKIQYDVTRWWCPSFAAMVKK